MIHTKPIIGLIGSIGAGKSVAAERLAKRGGMVIDADRLGHLALDQPGVKASIALRWGDGVMKPDGSVNRRALAAIVFANEIERKGLEAIVYPNIDRMVHERIRDGMNNNAVRFVVLDAAVMLEAGWRHKVDRLLFIDAPRNVRFHRVAERSGWSEGELTSREAAQMPIAEKRLMADAVVDNDGTMIELQTKLDRVLHEWGLWESNAKDVTCRPN